MGLPRPSVEIRRSVLLIWATQAPSFSLRFLAGKIQVPSSSQCLEPGISFLVASLEG